MVVAILSSFIVQILHWFYKSNQSLTYRKTEGYMDGGSISQTLNEGKLLLFEGSSLPPQIILFGFLVIQRNVNVIGGSSKSQWSHAVHTGIGRTSCSIMGNVSYRP